MHVAQVAHSLLLNTVSTNGRVEPIANYPFYSPIATTVQAVYAQAGDTVPAGKLLIKLNDAQARAQVANAESAVKSAQATLYAVTHNGTLAERQAAAATLEQDRLARDQAQQNLDALTKLAATGAASQGEVSSARSQLQTAEATLSAAGESGKQRYSPDEIARAEAALSTRKHRWPQRSTSRHRLRSMLPSKEPFTRWTRAHQNIRKPAGCCCRWPI